MARDRADRVQAALIEAHQQILALQEENSQLREEKATLAARLAELETCDLKQLAGGAFAYVPEDKSGALKNGPWYCQPCFDDGKRAVVQFAKRDLHFDRYDCPRCGAAIRVANSVTLEPLASGESRLSNLDDLP